MKTDGSIMTTDGRMVLRECDYSTLLKLKQVIQSQIKSKSNLLFIHCTCTCNYKCTVLLCLILHTVRVYRRCNKYYYEYRN